MSDSDEALNVCLERCQGPEKCSYRGVIRYYPDEQNTINYIFCEKFLAYEKKMKIFKLIEKMIPSPLLEKSFENFLPCEDKKALEISKAFVKKEVYKQGDGLIFIGKYGVGKTHLAVAIAKALITKLVPTLFLRSSELIQGSFEQVDERIKNIKDYDVVVLDDFVEEKNSYFAKNLYRFFNLLYEENKSLIMTTNLSTMQLIESLGDRIFDRLSEKNVFYEFKSQISYRKKIRRNEHGL